MNFYVGTNFLIDDTVDKEKGMDMVSAGGAVLDERTWSVSMNTDFTNLQWYENYITLTRFLAQKHPNSYPTYLLDLGYVPLIYLPTAAIDIGLDRAMMDIVESMSIPNIRTRPTSFVRDKINVSTMDVWVHKIHGADILKCKPEDVRSIALIEEVFST